MKKLTLFSLFIMTLLSLDAQILWPDNYAQMTVKMPLTADTVIFSPIGAISTGPMACDCTFDLRLLTAPIKITFGGSELVLNPGYGTYAFASYANDSLPSTISHTAYRDTTNAHGGRYPTNIKPYHIEFTGHNNLGIRIWKLTNTGAVKFNCIFNKR